MENIKKAYIAGGCFWGMEDLFRVRIGVKDTEVGYLGWRTIVYGQVRKDRNSK